MAHVDWEVRRWECSHNTTMLPPLYINIIASTIQGLALKYLTLGRSFTLAILCYSWQHSRTPCYWESKNRKKINKEGIQENINREKSINKCKQSKSSKANVFSWRKLAGVCYLVVAVLAYSFTHQWKINKIVLRRLCHLPLILFPLWLLFCSISLFYAPHRCLGIPF